VILDGFKIMNCLTLRKIGSCDELEALVLMADYMIDCSRSEASRVPHLLALSATLCEDGILGRYMSAPVLTELCLRQPSLNSSTLWFERLAWTS